MEGVVMKIDGTAEKYTDLTVRLYNANNVQKAEERAQALAKIMAAGLVEIKEVEKK